MSEIKSFVHMGVEIGDHSVLAEDYLSYVKTHYNPEKLGFVLLHFDKHEFPDELFYEWAEYFRSHEIFFAFLYTQQGGAPVGKKSHLTPEIVARVVEIAGEYFVGDMIGETGGRASWPEGYYRGRDDIHVPSADTMREVVELYEQEVKGIVGIDRELGVSRVLSVEATALSRYNLASGVDYTFLETMCGDPQVLLPFARGATRAYCRELWGSHIAHEWYGGIRQDDALKYKRLQLAYKYAYLSGANFIYSESGDCGISGYGYSYDADHEFCREYRKVLEGMCDFAKQDKRVGQPKVKIAFVHGNLDGYTGWGGTTVWNQYNRPEWGFGAAEASWNILKDIQTSRAWSEVENYGEYDTSAAPAYGMFDVLPAEAPVSVMSQYDYLIFAGYNSMTEEIMDNLKQYVSRGGNLIMNVAHLNTSDKRDGEFVPIEGAESFFGCAITEDSFTVNSGVKFVGESLMEGVLYPRALSTLTRADGKLAANCDPILPGGFGSYAAVKPTSARVAAVLCDTFITPDLLSLPPAILENRYGEGVVTLFTTLEYPGHASAYPLYRAVVRELSSASHRACEVKLRSSDKVKFAVYSDRIYLLNTDYNTHYTATIEVGGELRERTLAPLELAVEKL